MAALGIRAHKASKNERYTFNSTGIACVPALVLVSMMRYVAIIKARHLKSIRGSWDDPVQYQGARTRAAISSRESDPQSAPSSPGAMKVCSGHTHNSKKPVTA